MNETPYDSLSYVWGQDGLGCNQPLQVRREGSDDLVTVHVTQSVISALQQLRQSGHEKAIWVDQICIDQSNPDEKAQQVRMMAKIYEKSSTVIIWLGKESGRSGDAMQYLRELSHALESGSALQGYTYQSEKIKALSELLRRSWFNRAWTLQEAANATKARVLCGEENIDYQDLRQMYNGCQGNRSREWRNIVENISIAHTPSTRGDERAILAHVLTIAKLPMLKNKEQNHGVSVTSAGSALMLFNRLRSCMSQYASDKIYSIYYDLPGEIKEALGEVDYNTPVEDLYLKFAAAQLCDADNMTFLAAAGTYRRNLAVPSWVPDFTHPEIHYSFAVLDEDCYHDTGQHFFNAGWQVPGQPNFAELLADKRTMKVKGQIFGFVDKMTQPFIIPSNTSQKATNTPARDDAEVPNPTKMLQLQMERFKIIAENVKPKARYVKKHLQECERLVESLELEYTNSTPSSILRLTLISEMEVLNGGPSFGEFSSEHPRNTSTRDSKLSTSVYLQLKG